MTGFRTKSGKILTDADIERLADEAEHGYDVSHLARARLSGGEVRLLREQIAVVQRWVSENGEALPTEFLHLLADLDWATRRRGKVRMIQRVQLRWVEPEDPSEDESRVLDSVFETIETVAIKNGISIEWGPTETEGEAS